MNPWLSITLLVLVVCGCQSTYSSPPTVCDDHCHATQRANCGGDDPAECVRDCERNEHAQIGDACQDQWHAVDDCLLRAPRAAFVCIDDHSQITAICLTEQRALSDCAAPGSGTCFDNCVRRSQACGTNLSDCADACRNTSRACQQVSSAFYTCLLDYPIACINDAGKDAGPDDIPCYYEALGFLACVQ